MWDSEFAGIVLNSLYVSLLPTLAAVAAGTPVALLLYLRGGRLAGAVEAFFNGLVAMPTVLLGLVLYLLLSRSGPLGFLNILYTLDAVVVGHAILVFPLYVSFAVSAFRGVDPRLVEVLRMFAVGRARALFVLTSEAWRGLLAAAVASFGRALGELGVALMLGGDIRYRTRVLTTAIAHETMLGNWDAAMALGAVLLTISLAVSASVYALGYKFRG
ncbi:MAG: ABC transporter permease [Pyrobaculum sp.]